MCVYCRVETKICIGYWTALYITSIIICTSLSFSRHMYTSLACRAMSNINISLISIKHRPSWTRWKAYIKANSFLATTATKQITASVHTACFLSFLTEIKNCGASRTGGLPKSEWDAKLKTLPSGLGIKTYTNFKSQLLI